MSNAAKFYIVPTVLYALVASPATYQATRGVLGNWVATSEGTAKFGGLILHALVFILLATLAMRYFPTTRSGYSHAGEINRQQQGTKMIEEHMVLKPADF